MNDPDAEREVLEQRLAKLRRVENRISFACGAALAALYWIVRFQTGTIVIYSWMIPFFIGSAVPKFIASALETKLENALRAITHPELPAARIVERALPDSSSTPQAPLPVVPLRRARPTNTARPAKRHAC